MNLTISKTKYSLAKTNRLTKSSVALACTQKHIYLPPDSEKVLMRPSSTLQSRHYDQQPNI